MTERKPPGVKWQSFIERQISEGIRAGQFRNLPGEGKPLQGLDQPHDDDWWIKEKLRREELSYLPPTLALRREVEIVREQIASATSEAEIEALVVDINRKILNVNSTATAGPPSNLMPLNLQRLMNEWRHRNDRPADEATLEN